MSGTDPVLSLDEVEVHFEESGGLVDLIPFMESRKSGTVRAVDGVSLDVYENDVIALVGESGCGKTTLGKTAIGVQRPTGGTVRYRGHDIWEARDSRGGEITFEEIRRSLQMVHQDPGSSLNPNRTVQSSLSRALKRWYPDMDVNHREAHILNMLERVEMTPAKDYANRYPHQLSGGEKQRAALVRALSMNPDVILADEAVSALDVSLRLDMMNHLLDLQSEMNTSFVFVSHNLSNARYLTQRANGRIAIMYLGEIVEIGTPEEILQNPKHPYTKVLLWSTPKLFTDTAEDMLEDPPVRTIDIPDPIDPPSGCKFHTRCEHVIPPSGMNIEQNTYNQIMDIRRAIGERTLDTESTWERIEAPADGEDADATTTPREELTDEFVAELRQQTFDGELGSPHDERVESAFEYVAEEDWEAAADHLAEHYRSVCETTPPKLPGIDHPAACHLHEQPDRVTAEQLSSTPAATDD